MPELSIELLSHLSQVHPHKAKWNQLAGQRTQMRWEWLGSWADHYCREKDLMVLVVREGDQVIGYAPWYADIPQFSGRTIYFLGSGFVCTDHLSLLCEPGREQDVASAIAKWLLSVRVTDSRLAQWYHMQLVGVDADDTAINALAKTLVASGARCDLRAGTPCYGIQLPSTMEEFVSRRSRSGRRECKKMRKLLSDPQIEVVSIRSVHELPSAWYDFVDLHQQRQIDMGNSGCFEHVPFGEFLFDASEKLASLGKLQLSFLLLNGHPIAAHHAILSDDRWLFYQSGMDPRHAHLQPGSLLLYASIQQAISQGKLYFDMLRGDEAYKQRWRAEHVETTELRIAAPSATAYLQQRTWQLGKALKRWTDTNLRRVGS